jgi:nitrogen-specific signal transduction histidine kinase/CheY-like chemotaxis protein
MPVQSIKNIINTLPESNEKEVLSKEFNLFEKKTKKIETKYIKVTEDKLTLSHLLTEVNAELEESLANEKRFIASVSHELRTPLTAILGYSELLEDTVLNNKQKRYLNNIVQSSDHLLALISDLLDVAKLEDNRIELSPKEFDLDDMLNDCANLIKSKVAQGVNFINDIPLLDYPIITDDKRLKQVLLNLLSNAAKFTKKGSIRFYVKSMKELKDKKLQIIINIDDTGNGIPQEVSNTLFQPFQSTDKTQGTGLGLYISQQLAHLMGGDIKVESKIGIGSSFSVTIIVEQSNKREVGKELKGANIMMFAEKNDFMEKLSKEFMLHNINFQNYCTQNSDITSSLVQMVVSGQFYDLAVFDLEVFKDHTNHIAGTLRAINPDIKLVALVGEEGDKNVAEFDSVIHKPIAYQRFIKEMETIYAEEFFGQKEAVNYSQLKLLIVEDVEMNREYEKEMLNNFFSISCDTAINGKEAVEKAKVNDYDAILMDMRMPVMDGLEATRTIREFDNDTPIICMSANVYKEDKLAAKASGMNDFIEKPLSKKDIENKLIKVLNHEFTLNIEESPENSTKKSSLKRKVSGEELKEMAFKHLQTNFNVEISNKLYLKALESIEEYIKRLENSFSNKDTASLVEDFHIIKGVCANIGLDKIANQAGELQKIAEKGDFLALIETKDEIVDALNSLLKTQ